MTTDRRRWIVESSWVLLILAIAAALCFARLEDPRRIASSGDSYWFMRQAQIFAGVSPAEASAEASQQLCRDKNRAARDQGRPPDCVTYDQSGISDRYVQIFSTRPGYPLVASVFVRAFGAWRGMMVATVGLAMLAAVLAYLAVWLATGRRFAGFVASVLLLLLPCGFWLTRMLAEGATAVGYFGVLIGVTLIWKRRTYSGLAIATTALFWLFTARSANGLALVLTLLAASILMLLTGFPYRRGALITGGLAAVALAGWLVLSTVLQLPGLNETIQDFATRHFERPDIPDPYTWLYHKNLQYWPRQWPDILVSPWSIFAFLLTVPILFRKLRQTAWVWVISATNGLVLLVAHPAYGEYDRLMMPLWLTVSCAIGWAATLAVSWRPEPAADATPAGAPEPTSKPAPAPAKDRETADLK
jgi:hypothetical protein